MNDPCRRLRMPCRMASSRRAFPAQPRKRPPGCEQRHLGVLVLVERQERPRDAAPRMTGGAREALFVPDDFLSNPMAAHLCQPPDLDEIAAEGGIPQLLAPVVDASASRGTELVAKRGRFPYQTCCVR